jgi:hypothetical protein
MKPNTQKFYRFLTVFAPVLSVLCAGGVTIYEWQRLKQLEAATTASEKKLTAIEREIRDFSNQPIAEKYPTEEKTPREQAQFLDMLRANADASHVQLVRWSNTTPPPVPPPANGQPDPRALPTGVSPIISIVEVTGHSNNTRQFLYALLRSRRLLNMSDLNWIRENWPLTHLTFTLTRYVGPSLKLPQENQGPEGPSTALHPAVNGANSNGHAAGSPANPAPAGSGGNASFSGGPINVPGLNHGAYQSKLDESVHQLNDTVHSQDSPQSRPPALPDGKR